jgi:hypothetical protein
VDRWEQHFIEKSRRRFEAERLERRGQRLKIALTIGLLSAVVLAAAIGALVLR